jgi:hypothetical protein
MAILFPVLSRVRKQAKAMICQGHLRQWGMLLATYTEDNQGRFPSNTATCSDGVWLLRGAFLSGKDPNGAQDSFYHFHTEDITCCPLATQPPPVCSSAPSDIRAVARSSISPLRFPSTRSQDRPDRRLPLGRLRPPAQRFVAVTGSISGCSRGSAGGI